MKVADVFESITMAFHNSNPLALEPGLQPFGPEPLRFDIFSFASSEAFSKSGADITLTIELMPPPLGFLGSDLTDSIVAWEYYDGDGWRSLEINNLVSEDVLSFKVNGDITFRIPDDFSVTKIGGHEDYWIRARLAGGDYGRPDYIIKSTQGTEAVPVPEGEGLECEDLQCSNTIHNVTIDIGSVNAPRINNIEVSFTSQAASTVEHFLVQNNLCFRNSSQASADNNASVKLFEHASELNNYINKRNQQKDTSQRFLYFGFSKPFDIRPLSIFVDAEEQDKNVELDFEVLAKDEWQKVNAIDETHGFHRRGFTQIFVDFKPRLARLFDKESYWLRVRPHQSDNTDWTPILRGTFINAVRAEQAKSIQNEVLGSSAGEPDLKLLLSNQSVLPDSLELRIKENLSDEEREVLLYEADDLPVHEQPVRNFEEANLQGDWVLWQRIDSFIGYQPDNRVYRLDPVKGEIQFGNDRQGRVPPAGSGHIRAIRYQTGGGIRGNTGAYTITGLKSGVEGVETVANPVQAAGGTDAPTIEGQITQAPARLRRAGRAMTPRDIEALAVSTSPDLVRARCLFPKTPDDPIQVAITMRKGERCPEPSLAEQDALARLIRLQSWGGLLQDDIRISAPHYIPVRLKLSIFPDADENAAKLEQSATDRIRLLLHPVDGGPKGEGWLFGRRVWESDILRALAEIPVFDSVAELQFSPKEQEQDFNRMPELGMICAFEEDIQVSVEPRKEVT